MFLVLAQELGVPLAENKTEGPAWQLTFLGIQLDTVAMTLRLPEDKLVDLKGQVSAFMGKQKVLLKELQWGI